MNIELINKYLSGNLPPHEIAEVQQWLLKSLENKKEFEIMKKIIQAGNDDFNPDIESALNNIMNKLPDQKKKITSNRPVLRWAASIILLLGILGILGYKYLNNNIIELITYTQSIKTDQPLVLSDSSKIWLRPGAEIVYPSKFKGKLREMNFKGEAYFSIAGNKKKPFIVHTSNSQTEVLGTEFILRTNAADSSTIIIVEEGKVAFSSMSEKQLNSTALILAGEKAFTKGPSKRIFKTINDEENFQAWKTHVLTFTNANLEKAIRDIEYCYQIEFDPLPESLKYITITSVYRGFGLKELLENIQITLNITIVESNGKYQVLPNS